MGGEVRVEVERPIERWRVLVQGILCIPHLLVNGVLTAASAPVTLWMGIVVLLGRPVPPRLAAFQVMVLRERVRAYSYLFLLRRSRPPYAFDLVTTDPGDDPVVTVSIEPPLRVERGALLRSLWVLPQVLVLAPVGLVMDVLYPVWMVVAIVNRGWPPSIERIIVGVERWVLAIVMYVVLVSNERPRFGLSTYD